MTIPAKPESAVGGRLPPPATPCRSWSRSPTRPATKRTPARCWSARGYFESVASDVWQRIVTVHDPMVRRADRSPRVTLAVRRQHVRWPKRGAPATWTYAVAAARALRVHLLCAVMFQPPKLRLALGLGDQELEQRLRPAFDARRYRRRRAVPGRRSVLQAVDAREVDAVVVAWSLHGSPTPCSTSSIARACRWCCWYRSGRGALARPTRSPLSARSRCERHPPGVSARLASGDRTARPPSEPGPAKPDDRPDSPRRVSSRSRAGWQSGADDGGDQSGRRRWERRAHRPGRAGPVRARGGGLPGRDPSRNMCTLAHAVRDDPTPGTSRCRTSCSHCRTAAPPRLLCGPPKREMRASLGPTLVERLIAELVR